MATTSLDDPRTLYVAKAESAATTRARRWVLLAEFGTARSAATIAWMIRNSKGLRAFEEYPPDTFETDVRGNQVWFRRKA